MQTEQSPSISLLLLVSVSYIFIPCSFHSLLLIQCTTVLSWFHLYLINFCVGPCCLSSVRHTHCLSLYLLSQPSVRFSFDSPSDCWSSIYSFLFTFTSAYCVPPYSCLLVLLHLFIQCALPLLRWWFPLLQFLSSVFYLSRHHLIVTLDVFHFSSFYSNLFLHSSLLLCFTGQNAALVSPLL